MGGSASTSTSGVKEESVTHTCNDKGSEVAVAVATPSRLNKYLYIFAPLFTGVAALLGVQCFLDKHGHRIPREKKEKGGMNECSKVASLPPLEAGVALPGDAGTFNQRLSRYTKITGKAPTVLWK